MNFKKDSDLDRRHCCVIFGSVLLGLQPLAFDNLRFVFRIKTKDGGIIGNIVIEATDEEAAKAKVMERYPGCTILNIKVK